MEILAFNCQLHRKLTIQKPGRGFVYDSSDFFIDSSTQGVVIQKASHASSGKKKYRNVILTTKAFYACKSKSKIVLK